MSKDKMLKMKIEGVNVQLDKSLIEELKVNHNVDAVEEVTKALRTYVSKG